MLLWLSDSQTNSRDRVKLLATEVAVTLPDGSPVTDSLSSMIGGTTSLTSFINQDATGNQLSGTAWTGTGPSGTVSSNGCGGVN